MYFFIITEEQNVSQSDEVFSCIEEKEAKENFTIFHIHISETKCPDNVVRVSVTLNKRRKYAVFFLDYIMHFVDETRERSM